MCTILYDDCHHIHCEHKEKRIHDFFAPGHVGDVASPQHRSYYTGSLLHMDSKVSCNVRVNSVCTILYTPAVTQPPAKCVLEY